MTEVQEEGEAGVEEEVAALAATVLLETLMCVPVFFGVRENDKFWCVCIYIYIYKRKEKIKKARKMLLDHKSHGFIDYLTLKWRKTLGRRLGFRSATCCIILLFFFSRRKQQKQRV
jgi:hypothetical protein